MRKRITALLLVMLLCAGLFALPAYAADAEDFTLSYDLGGQTVTIAGGGLDAGAMLSLRGFVISGDNDELDYLDQLTADENGDISCTYTSGGFTFGDKIKVILAGTGVEIAKEITVTAEELETVRKEESETDYLTFVGTWGMRAQIGKFSGHIAKQSSTVGDSMSFTFNGDYFRIISYKSYSQGRFDVYLDGVKVTDEPVDLYDPGTDTLFQYTAFEKLVPSGDHSVTIVVVDKSAASIGRGVYIDAIDVSGEFTLPGSGGGTLVDDEILLTSGQQVRIPVLLNDDIPADTDITEFTQPANGSVVFEDGIFLFTPETMDTRDTSFTYSYGGDTATVTLKYAAGGIRYEDTLKAVQDGLSGDDWATFPFARYSGGSALRSGKAGDEITVDFYGTGIDIIGYKSWSRGIVEITVDGITTTVDTFDMTYDKTYGNSIYSKGSLTPGSHTLTIRVTGDRYFLASGNAIDIDAFVVTK